MGIWSSLRFKQVTTSRMSMHRPTDALQEMNLERFSPGMFMWEQVRKLFLLLSRDPTFTFKIFVELKRKAKFKQKLPVGSFENERSWGSYFDNWLEKPWWNAITFIVLNRIYYIKCLVYFICWFRSKSILH